MKVKWITYSLLFLVLAPGTMLAQVDTAAVGKPIRLKPFLALVGAHNLEYAARQFELSSAEARTELAAVFPDPQLASNWFDNGQRRMEMGYGFSGGLTWTVELGGKRKARIDLAKSEAELTKYLLQDYFRTLRADATLNFIAAIENKYMFLVIYNSYVAMNNLAVSDSMRHKLGKGSDVDHAQSMLEVNSVLNEIYSHEAKWKSSLINVALLTGELNQKELLLPEGDFSRFDREFNLQELIVTAQNSRADALAALQSKNVSQKALRLAKANRVGDIEMHTSFLAASHTKNIIAPTPSFFQMSAGFALPLKFSSRQSGDLKLAYYSGKQAELMYRQAELNIEAEVTTAYTNYIIARKQVNQFKNGMLKEAKQILESKTASYKEGKSSLLEVLDAERTYNLLQLSYYETLYKYAASLVELEKAAGIWDIDF